MSPSPPPPSVTVKAAIELEPRYSRAEGRHVETWAEVSCTLRLGDAGEWESGPIECRDHILNDLEKMRADSALADEFERKWWSGEEVERA